MVKLDGIGRVDNKLHKKKPKKRIVVFCILKKLDKVVEQVGGGSVINGAYPV